MATAAEIAAKDTEFQAAVNAEQVLSAEYEALRGPYLAKRAELNDARQVLENLDGEMEQLTKDYTPPAKAAAE
jgi:hypothetical protein